MRLRLLAALCLLLVGATFYCGVSTCEDEQGTTITLRAVVIDFVCNIIECTSYSSEAEGNPDNFLGETGSFESSTMNSTRIDFKYEYSNTPIVLLSVSNENQASNENAPITQLYNVSTTGFNAGVCFDEGTSSCPSGYNNETVHYFVFDVDACNNLTFMYCGNITTAVDGGSTTSISFDSIVGTKYVFTHPQTYNQAGGHPVHSWITSVDSDTAATLHPCRHHGIGNNCDSGFPTETYGYVVFKTDSPTISGVQFQTHTTGNSDWTSIAFSPSYTTPRIMVDQNSDSGGQDPQYVMWRSLTTSGADTRYCEQDGANNCDSHNGETIRSFTVEDGVMTSE